MIYKNKKLLLARSKEPKIRKKSPTKKHTSPAISSITKQIPTCNYSEHITIDSSQARQDSTEGNTVFRLSPSSQTPVIFSLVLLLFITIFAKHHYFSTPETYMERPSHRYSDSHNQISMKEHHYYHFFHRTRLKPTGQPTSPPTLQPADQPTRPPSLFLTSQSIVPWPTSQPTDQSTGHPSLLPSPQPKDPPT